MLSNETTTFYPLPVSEFNQLKADINYLKGQLSKKNSSSPEEKEWLTRLEFMGKCSIGSTQFNIWKNQDKLQLNRVGSKVYVHRSCVDQYFAGAFTSK